MTFPKMTRDQYIEDIKEFWLSRVKRIDGHREYLEDKLASLRHVPQDADLRAALVDAVAASEAKHQEALRARDEQMEKNVELRAQLRDLMNKLDENRKARKDEELVLQAAVASQDQLMVECEKDVGKEFRKIFNKPETRNIASTAKTITADIGAQTASTEFEVKKQCGAASVFTFSSESRSEFKVHGAEFGFAHSTESDPKPEAVVRRDTAAEPRETVFPEQSPFRTIVSPASQHSTSSVRDREASPFFSRSVAGARELLGKTAAANNKQFPATEEDAPVTSKHSYRSDTYQPGQDILTLDGNQSPSTLVGELPPEDYPSIVSEPERQLSRMMSDLSHNTAKSVHELDLLEQLQSMKGAATPSVWTAAILYHPDLSMERDLLARVDTLAQTTNVELVEQNWSYIEEIGRRIGAAIDVTCDSDDIELTLKMMRDSSLEDLEKVYRPIQAKLEQDEGKSLQLLLELCKGYFSRSVPKLTGVAEYLVAVETQAEVDAFLSQFSSRLPFPCKLHIPGPKGLLRVLEKKHLLLPTVDIARAALEFNSLDDLTTTLELLNQAADVRRVTCRFGPAGSGTTGWGDVVCVLVLNGCPWELQLMHKKFVAVDMSRTEAYSSYRYANQMLQYMEKRD